MWKTFRSKPNAIPVDDKNCSPSHRNRVHLQTGMLFGITTESCSASDRNRVHLRPDSPVEEKLSVFDPLPGERNRISDAESAVSQEQHERLDALPLILPVDPLFRIDLSCPK